MAAKVYFTNGDYRGNFVATKQDANSKREDIYGSDTHHIIHDLSLSVDIQNNQTRAAVQLVNQDGAR